MSVAVRIVSVQVGVVLLAAVLLAGRESMSAAVVAGGACAILPNAWLAWRMRLRPGRQPGWESRRLLLAWFEKLGLTAILLALALTRLEGLHAPAFFAGFIVALATHHAALAIVTREGREA